MSPFLYFEDPGLQNGLLRDCFENLRKTETKARSLFVIFPSILNKGER